MVKTSKKAKKAKKQTASQKIKAKPKPKLKLKIKQKKKKTKPVSKDRSIQNKSKEIKDLKISTAEEPIKKTKIRVIGIGGGGGTIVSEIALRIQKASFVAANTDSQALKSISQKVVKFNFGHNLTQGLGTGMNVGLGEQAAFQEKDKIAKLLEGYDLTIFVVSLGGGTGSGAAPVFAKISRSLGNLTFGIFTLPFKFEGEKKMEIALDSLKKIRPHLNAFSVIPNERVFQVIDKNTPLRAALSAVNKILTDGLEGLIETIYEPGLINIDFADFKTILEGQGRLAYLNTVSAAENENSRQELINKAVSSPLYPYGIKGARTVLFDIAGEKDLELSEVSQISKTISDLANKDAKIIFGISQNRKYAGSLRITLLATGCVLKNLHPEAEKPKIKIIRVVKKEKDNAAMPPKEAPLREIIAKTETKKEESVSEEPKKSIQQKKNQEDKKKKRQRRLFRNIIRKPVKSEAAVKFQENTVDQQERVRKNAIQLREEIEAEEREIQAREQIWDTPAFLRQKKS